MTCQFPISGSATSQVYVSRLDSANTTSDDVILPDPSTLPCPDPVLGTLYERGISENMAIRGVSDPYVTFKFNLPSDGDCPRSTATGRISPPGWRRSRTTPTPPSASPGHWTARISRPAC